MVHMIWVRFNKEALERRLRFIGDLYRTKRLVDVWCGDWAATVAGVSEQYLSLQVTDVLMYMDPPYLASPRSSTVARSTRRAGTVPA